MAKSFSSVKNKLGLFDFLTFGKYEGCRIDSIRDMDIEYLQYLKHEKIVRFDQSVIDSMANKYAADGVDVQYDEEAEYQQELVYGNNSTMFDDVPF